MAECAEYSDGRRRTCLPALGFLVNRHEFLYAWLLGFMFFLSFCLGALFLVLLHHLFDAGWSVPIRRFCEHICHAALPLDGVFVIPIAVGAKAIYPWMMNHIHELDHALQAKQPLFSIPMVLHRGLVLFRGLVVAYLEAALLVLATG